jgi:hypothetical protein
MGRRVESRYLAKESPTCLPYLYFPNAIKTPSVKVMDAADRKSISQYV